MIEKRVLILASGDLWAGAEAMVFLLASGLTKFTKFKVAVVLLNHGKLEKVCRKAGIELYVINEQKKGFLGTLRELVRIGCQISPHIIHSHRYKENLLAALIAPALTFPKLISTIHGRAEVINTIKTILTFELDKFVLAFFFSKIVTVSEDLRNFYSHFKLVSSDKVCTIYNGINIPKRPRVLAKADVVTIGSAGRLTPVKDFLFMVEVAKEICNKFNMVKFVLAGAGPEEELILARLQEYRLGERFELLGHVDDISKFYNFIDIFINTSISEGMPMTVLEAMSYGIPVIAPNIGGIFAMIENEIDGYLVFEKKISLFCNCIEELLNSPDKLSEMGEHAREKIISNFSVSGMVEEYKKLYETFS